MAHYTIDIDTGGTFTDGFFSYGERFEMVKVDTTPHDLTICFNNCIAAGAKKFGFDNVNEFLRDTKTIRLSTTVGTNSIIQRTGPKLGLIVTHGYERSLYQSEENPILNFLIHPDLIVSVHEQTDEKGNIIEAVQEEEVRKATKQLLEMGARAIVISFKNAHLNNENEKRAKQIIQEDFPRHYLGTKPIQLGSEISPRPDDGIRTNAAIVNAYLHRDMVKYLYKADEGVREKDYAKPLLIAHANGGVARVAKTKALDTYNSGPAAGVMGAKYVGRLYGIDHIMTIDIGGTSTDVGIIDEGGVTFDTESAIAGIPVHAPLIHVLSVGGGGGTIAKIGQDGKVQLGPESAGAVPGPACFDIGGTKPTVTDACVVLGLVDPDYFLGGTKKISKQKAVEAINKWIAEPLNLSTERAAALIVDNIQQIGADTLKNLAKERDKDLTQFQLFSFGGGGGMFAGGIAKKSGIKKVFTFPYSSVFSAFGLSTSDVAHTYEERLTYRYKKGMNVETLVPLANAKIDKMKKLSYRDMRGEGFNQEAILFTLSVECSTIDGKRRDIFPISIKLVEENLFGQLQTELDSIVDRFGEKEMNIEFIRLNSYVNVSRYSLPELELDSGTPTPKKQRDVFWEERPILTNIYDLESLRPGHLIQGPAILESSNTTFVVPIGAKFEIDQHLNGILEV